TVSLSFEGDDINRTEIPVSVELLNFGEEAVQVDAGAARFGGYVSDFLKHSFRLHFRSRYGRSRLDYPLFAGFEYEIPPVNDFDALELRAGNHDMVDRGAYLSNRFTDDAMIEMGNIAPHGRSVHVYFNGKYHGQYYLRERWNAAMLASYFEGGEEDYDAINADNIGCCEFANGEAYDGDSEDWNEIIESLNGSTPYRATREMLDVPNLIDFMLLWTSGRAEPEFRAAGSVPNGVGFKFFIKDADGHLRPTGLWEVDHPGPLKAMDRFRREGDPDFKILLADRIQQHFFNGGALTPEGNIARLQRRVDEMAPGYVAEVARWRVHRTANNNPGPQLNRTPEAWLAYQEDLIDNQFPVLTDLQLAKFRQAGMLPDLAAPVLSQHGGSLPPGGGVTLTSEVPEVYFTTDNSDPRLPGGAINPGARLAPLDDAVVAPRDFISSGASWRYLDDGRDPGSAWREPDFDDSGWAEGPSELGYGEGDEATPVGFVDANPDRLGIQRNATTYFRHTVELESPFSYSAFTLRLKYDDAAAVFLNGREVLRTPNLPATAAFDTYATSDTPDEEAFFAFTVPTSEFVAGENTLAVEIHNAEGSSDLSFDLTLRGEVAPDAVFLTEPIVLGEAAPFKVRARDPQSGEWSP
ncbi:MAG TPA: CotH kinase family protein, partial [Oceanipulchritudo sp.]|nr:CotH kinase family protein [Oceanipulchritudo sp.]